MAISLQIRNEFTRSCRVEGQNSVKSYSIIKRIDAALFARIDFFVCMRASGMGGVGVKRVRLMPILRKMSRRDL